MKTIEPQLISDMQGLFWADRDIRQMMQKQGINVVPVNFYSSIPTIEEIQQSYEYTEQSPPYLNEEIFKVELMRQWLDDLIAYSEDFAPPIEGNEDTCENGFFWKNGQFSYSDAMAYYAVLRKTQPKRVVEIGSGFSTLVAAAAIKANGFGSITCIEPYPRPFLSKIENVSVEQIKAQDITPEQLNDMLDDGDVFFIDSTHTVKTGSDCLHIYLRLMPKIRKNIYVHIHDIFLPFGVPQDWLLDLQIHWTEQYLVLAWLQDNPRTSVLYGSAYHMHFNNDLLLSLMRGRAGAGGGSLWLEYRGKRDGG